MGKLVKHTNRYCTSARIHWARAAAIWLLVIAGMGWQLLQLSGEWVSYSTRGKILSPGDDGCAEVAVVLGTAPHSRRGYRNPYFFNRIKAAAELYHTGCVKKLLVSGDNGSRQYNEPLAMKQALIAEGVPASAIHCDYAGFRTFDSMIRAWKVFGLKEFIVVSQDFHLQRALFIADAKGLNVRGYPAATPSWYGSDFITRIRERLARVKCILDLYVLNTHPKFLGKPVAL